MEHDHDNNKKNHHFKTAMNVFRIGELVYIPQRCSHISNLYLRFKFVHLKKKYFNEFIGELQPLTNADIEVLYWCS